MRFCFILLYLSSVFCLNGQEWPCAFSFDTAIAGGKMKYQHFLSAVQQFEQADQIHNRSITYIPVVIHVVAREGFQMVTRAQALEQIDVLNKDFAGEGENVHRMAEEFRSLLGSSSFRFCLATTDPEGQPTSGITHTLTNITQIGLQFEQGRRRVHYDAFGGKDGWDPQRYINVWVCEFSSILGSATFPGMAPFEEETGIVININHFGTIGDAGGISPYDGGHTLTHEMGHYFGLRHIWGDGDILDCNDSDDIDDTPNAAGPYFNCPSGQQISCGTSDMYQNFMDLTDDRCLSIFTHDQIARMEAVVAIFYPQLQREMPCTIREKEYSDWLDGLIWSHDAAAGKYIVYHPLGFEGTVEVSVYSVDGKRIFQDVWYEDYAFLIDLSRVSAGMYLVALTFGEEHTIRKIVHY